MAEITLNKENEIMKQKEIAFAKWTRVVHSWTVELKFKSKKYTLIHRTNNGGAKPKQ